MEVIDQSGYFGIFILSLVESAGAPIPSEVVVPFSAFLAFQGRFNFWLVVTIATIANLFGGIILYFISLKGGRRILERYGKYIFISHHELSHADRIFAQHGSKIIFIGRLLPAIRTYISIPAGIAKMDFKKFFIYTLTGSLPWNFGLALIGFKAGENWEELLPYFRRFDFVIIGAVIIAFVWYIYRHIKRKHLFHG